MTGGSWECCFVINMSHCCGNGKCLEGRECECLCVGIIHTCTCGHSHPCGSACACGHKTHNGHCPHPECEFDCRPCMCWNWQLCKEYAPQYVLNANRGMTPMCEKTYGRISFVYEKEYCYMCDHETLQIQLECGHVYCRGCFYVDILINRNWNTLAECGPECRIHTSDK